MSKKDPSELLTIPGTRDGNGKFIPQLVRIKVNPAGEFKMFMTAKDYATTPAKLGFTDDEIFSLDYVFNGRGSTSGRGYGGYYATKPKSTVYFKIIREDGFGVPEVTVVDTYPKCYANMKLYDLDQFWTAGAMVYQDYDLYAAYQDRALVVTKVYTQLDANGNPKKCIEGYQNGKIWSFVEAEEGIIDHYIPEGVKIGDVVAVQVDTLKNLVIAKRIFALGEKQDPTFFGKITEDGFTYIYGYLCAKRGTDVVLSMNDPELADKENIQLRAVPTTANVYIYDVQEETVRKCTINELPVNATRVGDQYIINDEDVLLFIRHTRQNAKEVVLVKY